MDSANSNKKAVMSFIAELRRRNVFRIGIAYAIATWVLLQITEVITPILGLPDWAPKLIFVILAVGFVAAEAVMVDHINVERQALRLEPIDPLNQFWR